MPDDLKPKVRLEIGHVLFLDIVGYSKLLISEQSGRLQQLKEIVWATEQFRVAQAEGKLLRLPTGDGGALVFRTSPEAPVLCAQEISRALKLHPELPVRMGIHSGPVNEVSDLNEQANMAGAGINIAQRVMDCGDAGHILLSKRVADDIDDYSEWRPHLHDLGDCEVKHGVRLHLFNLYGDDFGNPALPGKLQPVVEEKAAPDHPPLPAKRAGLPWPALLAALLLVTGLAAGVFFFRQRTTPTTTTTAPAATSAATPTPAAIPEKSIAVLPFENLSSEKENAYFTDGVQDEILTDLAKIADLKVISRTSVMQYKEIEKRNLPDIAQALKVAHVLEGSVQRSANRVRVTAQLIDARSDTHLWAERYDREIADVFAIQSEIAQKIAGELRAVLSPRETASLQAKPTSNVAAYEFYLRASELNRDLISTESRAELMNQLSLFEQAVTLDPQFVSAWCMVARTHLVFYWSNHDHSESRLAAANEAIGRAAALQPDAAEVHVARAYERYYGYRDYAGAIAELEKARQTLPNDAEVVGTLGLVERRAGRWDDSIRHLEAALALDPQNGGTVRNLRDSYSVLRRYDEAARVLDQALRWRPHEFRFAWPRAADEVYSTANLQPMRDVLSSPSIQTADTEQLTEARLTLAFYERDYARARDIVARFDGATITAFGYVTPRQWYEGRVAAGLGDHTAAAAAFQSAREAAAEAVTARPDDAKALIILAQIDARLGRKESAIEEAERARALLPVEKDAFDGPHIDWLAAGVYAQVGQPERALDLLEQGLRRPRGVAYGSLRLSDEWDLLRDNPRFDKLLKSLAPKKPINRR